MEPNPVVVAALIGIGRDPFGWYIAPALNHLRVKVDHQASYSDDGAGGFGNVRAQIVLMDENGLHVGRHTIDEIARHTVAETKSYQLAAVYRDVPALLPLLTSGAAYLHSGICVTGIAADGVRVSLGSIDTKQARQSLQRYLVENPSPDCW